MLLFTALYFISNPVINSLDNYLGALSLNKAVNKVTMELFSDLAKLGCVYIVYSYFLYALLYKTNVIRRFLERNDIIFKNLVNTTLTITTIILAVITNGIYQKQLNIEEISQAHVLNLISSCLNDCNTRTLPNDDVVYSHIASLVSNKDLDNSTIDMACYLMCEIDNTMVKINLGGKYGMFCDYKNHKLNIYIQKSYEDAINYLHNNLHTKRYTNGFSDDVYKSVYKQVFLRIEYVDENNQKFTDMYKMDNKQGTYYIYRVDNNEDKDIFTSKEIFDMTKTDNDEYIFEFIQKLKVELDDHLKKTN